MDVNYVARKYNLQAEDHIYLTDLEKLRSKFEVCVV